MLPQTVLYGHPAFSTQNEQLLLPHVSKIVLKLISLSTSPEEPGNYILLVRSLFCTIAGGRFKHLYKEILPLPETLREVLNTLLISPQLARHERSLESFLGVHRSLSAPGNLPFLPANHTHYLHPSSTNHPPPFVPSAPTRTKI